MEHVYEFAIARLTSTGARDERLNIGVIVLKDGALDVRPSHRLDKVHAMTGALSGQQTREFLDSLAELDKSFAEAGITDAKTRLAIMTNGSPLSVSAFGTFAAVDHMEYEGRVASLLRSMVDPEPGLPRAREKRSRLLTAVKIAFRDHKVLARKGETIDSHRLVQKYEIDQGLTADLALKNGSMHFVETVDASGDDDSYKHAISQIGVAALVLERGRMKFGEGTKSRLVYAASPAIERIAKPALDAAEHQGAILTNWASNEERRRFVDSISALASPVTRKSRQNSRVVFGPTWFLT